MAGLNKSNVKQRSAKEIIKRLALDLPKSVPYIFGVGWDDPQDSRVYEAKKIRTLLFQRCGTTTADIR